MSTSERRPEMHLGTLFTAALSELVSTPSGRESELGYRLLTLENAIGDGSDWTKSALYLRKWQKIQTLPRFVYADGAKTAVA